MNRNGEMCVNDRKPYANLYDLAAKLGRTPSANAKDLKHERIRV